MRPLLGILFVLELDPASTGAKTPEKAAEGERLAGWGWAVGCGGRRGVDIYRSAWNKRTHR